MIIAHAVDPCYIYLKSALRMDIKQYIFLVASCGMLYHLI